MEGNISLNVKIFMSIVLVFVLGLFMHLYSVLVIKPKKIREMLRKQGINGPPPKILLGNILEIKKSRNAAQKTPTNHPHPPVSHDSAAVFPFFQQWRKQYGIKYLYFALHLLFNLFLDDIFFTGQLFAFSLGNMQIIYVNDPDLVKEISTGTSLDLGRPKYYQKELSPLLGQGILSSNGAIWALQRKIMLLSYSWTRLR